MTYSKQTFDNFITGETNKIAYKSAKAVAENPARCFNPLYIHSSTGLGKTHLLNAIGNYARATKSALNILYVTTESFFNELIGSIRHDNIGEFREKYRGLSLLLIDDIQFLAGKERSQEEFVHTFDALYNFHGQVVVAADRLPEDMSGLDSRIKSRFEGGLIVEIQPPDANTRIAILKKCSEADGIKLSDNVAHFIAGKELSNINELKGCYNKLAAFSKLEKAEITLSLAEGILGDFFPLTG